MGKVKGACPRGYRSNAIPKNQHTDAGNGFFFIQNFNPVSIDNNILCGAKKGND